MALAFEPLLHETCEGEVHVVAAQQDVIADRHALEREIPIVLPNGDQAEIGGAAPDVDDEEQVTDAKCSPPRLAHAVYPRVARGLRLLEERHVPEVGFAGCAKRQL